MQKFAIKKWAMWDFSVSDEFSDFSRVSKGQPVLAEIKPMVKRRLPPLAKAIQEININEDLATMPCVYASKNGELSRTIKLIRQYGGDLSPTMFSMSVHNAIAGLLSVINADHSPYTVIDSMSGAIEMAVFEAVTLLRDNNAVKVLYFEESTDEDMSAMMADEDQAMVLMFVVERGDEFSVEISTQGTSHEPLNHSNRLIKKILSLLEGRVDQVVQAHGRVTWVWKRH